MPTGYPMTLRSQLGVAFIAVLGVLIIIRLLHKRKINEGLFFLWLLVFAGMATVALSSSIQLGLTRIIGSYSAVSTMLLISLSFLFGASLVYSVMISNLNGKIRDITSYIAALRLDVDDLQRCSPLPPPRNDGPDDATPDKGDRR